MKAAERRLQAKITKLYMDMRLKRISKLNWMIESEKTVDALMQVEHNDKIPELFYAHLLITKEAYDSVEEIMDDIAEWLRGSSQNAPACHAYYLYLTTLLQTEQDYDERVIAKLNELAGKNTDVWQIQWLLYYVDKSLAQNPLEQYHFLKRMFISGCRSPLMYIEARALIERNPTFLYEFSEFEIHLMVFMIRHSGISERVSAILADYMLQRTDYRYLYLIILCGCYEMSPSKRILEGICRMMVLGGCTGNKYTDWYRKGISGGIQVSGLYEAFMKSLPVEQWCIDGDELTDHRRIPSEVMEYFAHTSRLDDVRTAYLYSIIHKYRDNWISVYHKYEPLIQPFMMDQLYKGQINHGLAYLYENVLHTSAIPRDKTEIFLDICHSHKVTALPIEEGVLRIQYAHSDIYTEVSFVNGHAIVPIYGKEYLLKVFDYQGGEQVIEHAVCVPMMDMTKWSAFFEDQQIFNILYHLSEAEKALEDKNLEKKAASIKSIFLHLQISKSFKLAAAEQMFPYWDINGSYEEITTAVPFVFCDMGTYSKEEETAFWKKQYMRNCIGIYGMQFLLDNYEGTLLEYGSIFKKASSLGIETGNYAKSIMSEMMQNGQLIPQHAEIFESYCSLSETDGEFLQEYIEYHTDFCYKQGQRLEVPFMKKQAELSHQGISFSTIAQLAYLQSMVDGGVGSAEQCLIETAILYIEQLLSANIYFSWMQPLVVICPQLASKEAFQVLEYRGAAGHPVWVRFSKYSEGKEEADSFQSEVMDEICAGVYTKSFILFYGERMHYEVFGLEGTEQKLLKQGILQMSQGLSDHRTSKFSKLNKLISLKEKRENMELYQELESYYGKSAMIEQLFTLK